MWSSSLCNSKVCPLQYLTRHVKASRSDFNYASCIAPVILIGHSVESVSSYVNCSIMLRIPHVHHPYAFLSREFMNYVIGSVWKRCKFVFFLLVWELLGVNSFTPIHFSPPPPPRLSQTPASAYSPTLTQKHTHTVKDVNKARGQRGSGDTGEMEEWSFESLSTSSLSASCCSFLPDGDTWLFDVGDSGTENTTPCSSDLV